MKVIYGQFIGVDYWSRPILKCLNKAKTGYYYLCDIDNLIGDIDKIKELNNNKQCSWYYKGYNIDGEPDFHVTNDIVIVDKVD